MQKIIHNINATGIPLGRLASQIAILLRGKQRPDFVPYKSGGDIVVIEGADQVLLTGKKRDQQSYFSHSGYPKGEKHTPMKKILESNPEEVLRRAVKGMLPHNKLSAVIIKNLKFKK